MRFRAVHAVVLTRGAAASGCDPVMNVFGSFFPAWVICTIVGIVFALALRVLLAAVGLETHLGPLAVVYPSLALLLTMLAWLVFYLHGARRRCADSAAAWGRRSSSARSLRPFGCGG